MAGYGQGAFSCGTYGFGCTQADAAFTATGTLGAGGVAILAGASALSADGIFAALGEDTSFAMFSAIGTMTADATRWRPAPEPDDTWTPVEEPSDIWTPVAEPVGDWA